MQMEKQILLYHWFFGRLICERKSNMNKVKAVVFGVMMSAAITANAANETTTVTGEVDLLPVD